MRRVPASCESLDDLSTRLGSALCVLSTRLGLLILLLSTRLRLRFAAVCSARLDAAVLCRSSDSVLARLCCAVLVSARCCCAWHGS